LGEHVPVDVLSFLTKSDHKLIAKAGRRSKKAADKMIARIAARAAKTAFQRNEKIAAELKDDTDRAWPDPFMTRPVRPK
jgi:hypothetical protein